MNIGFTGTRNGITVDQHRRLRELIIHLLHQGDNSFHHGDCVGADADAHRIVQHIKEDYPACPMRIVKHPPVAAFFRANCTGADAEWTRKSYTDRNRDIVACSDLLIACPKSTRLEKRSGTSMTIRFARAANVPVTIIWPNGRVQGAA